MPTNYLGFMGLCLCGFWVGTTMNISPEKASKRIWLYAALAIPAGGGGLGIPAVALLRRLIPKPQPEEEA